MNSDKELLHNEWHILTFYGKLDSYTVVRMPRRIREMHMKFTMESLKNIYGSDK